MKPFYRSQAIAAAITAILNQGLDKYKTQQALREVDVYHSRGKGGRKSPHRHTGVARMKREARKARNKA